MESIAKKTLSVLSILLVFCLLAGFLSSGLLAAQAAEVPEAEERQSSEIVPEEETTGEVAPEEDASESVAEPSSPQPGTKSLTPAEEKEADPLELGYQPGCVIVAFESDVSEPEAEALLEAHDSTLDTFVETAMDETISVADIPADQTVEQAVAAIETEPGVAYAQPAYIYEPMAEESSPAASVNDPYAGSQWHLDAINAAEAWDVLADAEGRDPVLVGVLDTPIDTLHEELDGILRTDLAADYKTGNYEEPSMSADSHGTHVAGIIGAKSNNGVGVAGVASGLDNSIVQILPVNVFNYNSSTGQYSGTNSAIAAAVNYAVTSGVKVINLSLASKPPSNDQLMRSAIDAAVEAGVTVVAAAGNYSNDDETVYPADYDSTISVININKFSVPVNTAQNPRYASSCYGETKDISAPGTSILSTYPTGNSSGGYAAGYGTKTGTSMATPVVSAVVAMLKYYSPDLTPDEIRTILRNTATDLYSEGFDVQTAWGCVNAQAALTELTLSPEISLESAFKAMVPGETVLLKSSVIPCYKNITWSSSDRSVATVAEDGTVTAVAFGKAVITATVDDSSATCEITVSPAVPDGLSASLNENGSTTLSWQRVANAEGYEIDRRLSLGSKWVKIGGFISDSDFSGTEASYTYTETDETIICIYRVRACAGTPGKDGIYPYIGEWSGDKSLLQKVPEIALTLKNNPLSSISIGWDAVADATGYSLYRSDSPESGFLLLKTLTGTSYSDKQDILPGTTYYYQVIPAFSSGSAEPLSDAWNNTFDITTSSASTPTTPSGLSVDSATQKSISLSWSSADNADGYTVERTLAGSGDKTVFEVNGAETSFTDSNVAANTSYHYTVSATRQAYSTTLSSQASQPVTEAALNPAIKNFRVSTYSYNTISIKWSAVPTAQEYNVYRSTKATSGFALQTTLNNSTTAFVDVGLKINTKYYYKVMAVHYADGKKVTRTSSTISRKASLKPTSANIKSAGITSIKLSWNKVSGASGYYIYCSTKKTSGFKRIKTVKSGAALSYKHTGLKPNKKYYYKIVAYRTVSGKKYKGTAYKSAAIKPLGSPKSLKASTPNCSTIKLSWKRPTSAKGYLIYMSTKGKSGSYKLIKTITNSKKLSYTVKNLNPNTRRYFKIRTYGTLKSKTVKGGTAAITVKTPALAKPANLKSAAASSSSVKLSWKKVSGASGYFVYRSLTGAANSFKLVKTITSGSTVMFTDTGLATDKSYYYRVQSYRTIKGKKVKGGTSTAPVVNLVADIS